MKTKTTALIGAGYWGGNLARNLHELGVLKAICDPSPNIRNLMAEKYPGVLLTDKYAELLAEPTINAVVIAAPAVKHFELARQALEAGKHVFVEKPLALNLDDGRALVELAEAGKKVLFVGHILHYHPASAKIKEILSDGTIGRLQYIYSNRLNLGKIRREENILWSFAPHDISLILSFTGEDPDYIDAIPSNFLHPDIADITMTTLKFPSGIGAHIFVSWLNPFKEQKLVVTGTQGMLVFDDTKGVDEKLVLFPHTIDWKNGLPVPKKADGTPIKLSDQWREPLKAECEAFLDAIEQGKSFYTTGREGLRVLKVLKTCQDAIEQFRQEKRSAAGEVRTAADYFAHQTAIVDDGAKIGKGTKIWHFSHVLKGAKIGENCILGQNVSIAGGVTIGNNVKIQNNVSVYTGTTIEDDVFLGPSCVLTNVTNPRSQVNRHSLYERTVLKKGATIGANATVVCGTTLGRYCFIAAGAVVAADVPDYALMMGVPARQKGWMSRHGQPLKNPDAAGVMVCPESGFRYRGDKPGQLHCLDLDEEAPLPEHLKTGNRTYDEFKPVQPASARKK